jgi:hypothetical protein
VEPLTAIAAATAATNLIVKAAQTLGEKLLDKATDAAGDEGVSLARRLLDRLLHRASTTGDDAKAERTQGALREALDELASSPADEDAAAAIRMTIRRRLEQDPQLLAEVRDLLATPQAAATAAPGARSVAIGGDNSGVVVTGDSNTVQR